MNELKMREKLKFRKCFNLPISEGIKTSTIRKHCNLKTGDIVDVYNDKEYTGIDIKVTNVSVCSFNELDNNIAESEGYLHVELLRDELKRIYDIEGRSELFYRIEFELVE